MVNLIEFKRFFRAVSLAMRLMLTGLLILGAHPLFATPTTIEKPDGAPKKNHLEDLFIWKVSEELKLSTPDEKKFSDALRALSVKKQAVSQKLDEVSKLFLNSKADKDRKKYFTAYRKALLDYNNLALEELDQMKDIFGLQKLAHYMEVKIDITNKIKAVISSPDRIGKDKKPLPSPKIIEE
jgi:hypothetical protein